MSANNQQIKDLEDRVAERYTVLPGIVVGAYEEIDSKRLTHYSFGYGVDGCVSDTKCVQELADALWGVLENAWPVGATVKW